MILYERATKRDKHIIMIMFMSVVRHNCIITYYYYVHERHFHRGDDVMYKLRLSLSIVCTSVTNPAGHVILLSHVCIKILGRKCNGNRATSSRGLAQSPVVHCILLL